MARFTEWCPELEAALQEPFPEDHWTTFEVPTKGGKKTQVPFVPWFRYAERLNELVGPHGWSVGELKAQVYGSPARMIMMLPLTILGVTKVQVGEDELEKFDKESGAYEPVEGYGGPGQRAYAQALKRAAALFGMGLIETYDKSRRGKPQQAARPQSGDDRHASPAQLRRIRALMSERVVPDDQLLALRTRLDGTLSRAKASEIISHLESLPRAG